MKTSPTPLVLYHYTSHDSLFNIVETRSLWASHVYYTNDSSEIKYAIDIFINLIKKRQGKSIKESNLLEQLLQWIQNLKNFPHYIFSFSLSEQGNLLSQWRAYTSHGTGVSIGFNFSNLKNYAEENNLTLVKCVYDITEQNMLLEGILNSILSKFNIDEPSIDVKRSSKGQEYYTYLNNFTADLLATFIRIKNQAFHEEREWRLVSKHYVSHREKDIKFRSGKTSLIPYVIFSLNNICSNGTLFQHIYVGPSPNFNLAFYAISAYLSNMGACNDTINSLQPYREI